MPRYFTIITYKTKKRKAKKNIVCQENNIFLLWLHENISENHCFFPCCNYRKPAFSFILDVTEIQGIIKEARQLRQGSGIA